MVTRFYLFHSSLILRVSLAGILFISLQVGCETNPPLPAPGSGDEAQTTILKGDVSFLDGYPAMLDNGLVHMVIEIPAGETAKWEVNKQSGAIEWEEAGDSLREVNYLGYPANYGFIPRTLLSETLGGDGDPLDIVQLGNRLPRGSVVACRLIGVMRMVDNGKTDDKLIAVQPVDGWVDVASLADLQLHFPGVTDILSTWFAHYKGGDQVVIRGFEEVDSAESLLREAVASWNKIHATPVQRE